MTNLTLTEQTEFDESFFHLSEWELEMMASPDDNAFFELFSESASDLSAPSPSIDEYEPSVTSKEELSFSPTNYPPSPIPFNIEVTPTSVALYRQGAIKRWLDKRSRRCFRKKIVSKARKDYAETRVRKGGRFTKSTSPGWVSITEIKNGL